MLKLIKFHSESSDLHQKEDPYAIRTQFLCCIWEIYILSRQQTQGKMYNRALNSLTSTAWNLTLPLQKDKQNASCWLLSGHVNFKATRLMTTNDVKLPGQEEWATQKRTTCSPLTINKPSIPSSNTMKPNQPNLGASYASMTETIWHHMKTRKKKKRKKSRLQ